MDSSHRFSNLDSSAYMHPVSESLRRFNSRSVVTGGAIHRAQYVRKSADKAPALVSERATLAKLRSQFDWRDMLRSSSSNLLAIDGLPP